MSTVLLVMGLALAAPAPDKPSVKQELKKLQGKWKIVKEDGGSPRKKATSLVLIKGNTIDFGDTTEGLEFRIDPTKSPKWFDIKLKLTKTVVETSLGIYKLDGDKLTICVLTGWRSDRQVRPKEFKAKEEKDWSCAVIHLQRVK